MNKKTEKKRISSCDICMNYTYDEDYECYTCEVDLDEDEMAHFMQDTYYNCPYFQMGDEYKLKCINLYHGYYYTAFFSKIKRHIGKGSDKKRDSEKG